jgi:hypothetical protein
MNNETYEKATELRESLMLLDEIWQISCVPYPKLEIFKRKRLGFRYSENNHEVDFVCLDKTTREELKKAIMDVVKKRREEIKEELEQL